MKHIAVGIIIGTMLGLLIGGIYWSNQYYKLSRRYDGAVELLRLYKNYYEQHNP